MKIHKIQENSRLFATIGRVTALFLLCSFCITKSITLIYKENIELEDSTTTDNMNTSGSGGIPGLNDGAGTAGIPGEPKHS